MGLGDTLKRIFVGNDESLRYSINDYINWVNSFTFAGVSYPVTGVKQTLAGDYIEPAPPDYIGLATNAFGANAIVFACMAVRQHVFSTVRFQWQQMVEGRPGRLFGNNDLLLLETPWPGGTTQDLLARMIQDADIAGTFYAYKDTPLARLGGDNQPHLVRLRPDYVEAVMEERMYRGGQVGFDLLGYIYTERGPNSGYEPVPFQPGELVVFMPQPDPFAKWRGMSWLTPIIREIQADALMTQHRRKFFENGATPNMIVRYPEGVSPDRIKQYRKLLDAEHAGVDNAYKRLHIGGGADASVIGIDFQQMTFKEQMGHGETRIAAAAGVHPVIVGLSEGLAGSSLNAGNYSQARRRFADGTMHPLWQNAAGSLQVLYPNRRTSTRLWYDTRDVPFLREDEKDAAEIAFRRSQTLRNYLDSGWTPESAAAALLSGDEGVLVHSGLFSVQLQKPGTPTNSTPQGGAA